MGHQGKIGTESHVWPKGKLGMSHMCDPREIGNQLYMWSKGKLWMSHMCNPREIGNQLHMWSKGKLGMSHMCDPRGNWESAKWATCVGNWEWTTCTIINYQLSMKYRCSISYSWQIFPCWSIHGDNRCLQGWTI